MIKSDFVHGISGVAFVVVLTLLFIATATSSGATANLVEPEATIPSQYASDIGHPTFVSPHTNPIAVHNGQVFVVNTPSATLDVIDANNRTVTARVPVGIDPVSVSVRPDGQEIWVSNHISDSVSIVDNDPKSPTYLHVIATVQAFDQQSKATLFDEPMGIAFANSQKAYVALSSDNQIAVVDVAERKVIKRLTLTAQDPRAIAVHNDKLYVIPFESNNKTQLSGGMKDSIDGDLVTFDAVAHSIVTNSKLSLGHVLDIVKHPDMPDRDLYVFDTETDELVETVDTLGTLLYGLTIDSMGRVFIAQTDARNDANGRAGTEKHGLKELMNRAFLNRITRVDLSDRSPKKHHIFRPRTITTSATRARDCPCDALWHQHQRGRFDTGCCDRRFRQSNYNGRKQRRGTWARRCRSCAKRCCVNQF
jgi:YVTN family beta-propeller protein